MTYWILSYNCQERIIDHEYPECWKDAPVEDIIHCRLFSSRDKAKEFIKNFKPSRDVKLSSFEIIKAEVDGDSVNDDSESDTEII